MVSGIDLGILDNVQSYVPDGKPVVPGHEVVCRIVAVGDQVQHHQVGERCLVQTDFRQLPTEKSNAAFGYNFEGGLQEYTVLDERIVLDTNGDRFLIPVSEKKSASAVALVEPWACVEDSYVTKERNRIKAGGKLLVVVEAGREATGLEESISPEGRPAETQNVAPSDVAGLPDDTFDDILYFGSNKTTIEILNDKLTTEGIINLVLGGEKIGAAVSVGVGRVHYGMTRWIGTTGNDASKSYATISADGEIRANDKVLVVGAGGPMGQMHVIRNICLGLPGVSVVGTDFDDNRIKALQAKVQPLADTNGVPLRLLNPQSEPLHEKFTYFALMAPIGALVASAIEDAEKGAIINIFAGIPAPHQAPSESRPLHRAGLLYVRHERIHDRRHATCAGQVRRRPTRHQQLGRRGQRHGWRDRRHRLRQESLARWQDHCLSDAARCRSDPAGGIVSAFPQCRRKARRRPMDACCRTGTAPSSALHRP